MRCRRDRHSPPRRMATGSRTEKPGPPATGAADSGNGPATGSAGETASSPPSTPSLSDSTSTAGTPCSCRSSIRTCTAHRNPGRRTRCPGREQTAPPAFQARTANECRINIPKIRTVDGIVLIHFCPRSKWYHIRLCFNNTHRQS